jgi:Reverse transcriptase (RNA-dependent DNA polymerase)
MLNRSVVNLTQYLNIRSKFSKDKLQHLCDIGVLKDVVHPSGYCPCASVQTKHSRVQWISDFQELNKFIKQKVYNLPKIHDILSRHASHMFLPKLDISMLYYTFELDKSSKALCTNCTPVGNCRYSQLLMGISQSPDIAQEAMEDHLRQFKEADVYIDDIGVFSNNWSDHLSSLSKILTLLEHNNFTINPLKCEWGVKDTNWLGYWLTPIGLKPGKQKIQVI